MVFLVFLFQFVQSCKGSGACLRRLDWFSQNFTPFGVFKGLLNPS